MDRDEKFSFISVNASDDDEIVIQTGTPHAVVSPNDDGESSSRVVKSPDEQTASAQLEVPTQSPFEDAPGGESENQTKPKYRETTREDLESVDPMSKMQKVVLVCALLFILAFAAYYIFLR